MSEPALDQLDLDILTLLLKDGRKSFTEIADTLDVSVGTVRNRYNYLVDEKILTIVGRVNPEKIGFHTYAQIYIKVRPVDKVTEVAMQISELPEVSFLAMTSGTHDLEVNVMCRNNEHLVKLTTEHIVNIPGVYETSTNIYFKVFKYAQPELDLLKTSNIQSANPKL
ncbi:MAG: Lrp/AsnC family transcriptional regulator [Chitinophagales bacterium]|nr:Lrp/AsnC family transcriptional regulator [Chitinophagales bacterium]